MNGPLIVILAGVACTATGLAWLLLMHARARLDLVDVVTEPDADGTRRASLRKIGEAVALGATTFVLIYAAFEDRSANEWLFGLYLGAWVSRTLFGMLAQAKAGAIAAVNNVGGK